MTQRHMCVPSEKRKKGKPAPKTLPLKRNPRAHKRFADPQPLQRRRWTTIPLSSPLVAHIADVLHSDSARPESRSRHIAQKTKEAYALTDFRLRLLGKRNLI